jgi:hypothetical protein
MTVLVPNTDEADRRQLPGGGVNVKLSWAPEHMHLVRSSEGNEAGPSNTEQAGEVVRASTEPEMA